MLSPLTQLLTKPYVIVLGLIVSFFVLIGFTTNLFFFKDRLVARFYQRATGPLSIIIHSMNVIGMIQFQSPYSRIFTNLPVSTVVTPQNTLSINSSVYQIQP
jgi:hypothetical protein